MTKLFTPIGAKIGFPTLLLCVVGCSSARYTEPKIRELYHEAAQREARNPVVVIHGILGSRLIERETNKIVWGAFTNDAIDVETPAGARAIAVSLPGPDGAMSYDPNAARVYPTGPVGAIDVSLFFGIISVNVYGQILQTLGVGGYSDQVYAGPEYAEDHFTCHTFFYDWRRDNVENAIALGRYLKSTRAHINRTARNKIASLRESGSDQNLRRAKELEDWLEQGYRFDLVAHSMGGLIARYYLRYGTQDLPTDGSSPEITWKGAEEIDRLIMVGTPNLGALDALKQLTEGFHLGLFLPSFHQAILGTMPSIYQLLPRNENRPLRDAEGKVVDIDLFDPDVWEKNGWGLMDPKSDKILRWLLPDVEDSTRRHQRAKEYLSWCLRRAHQLHAALDKTAQNPCPTEIRLFTADTISTPTQAIVGKNKSGQVTLRMKGKNTTALGDGTVPRYSAIGDRRFGKQSVPTWLDSPVPWSSITFLPDDHVGLTANPQFTNNLLFFLLEQRPRRSPPGQSNQSNPTTKTELNGSLQ